MEEMRSGTPIRCSRPIIPDGENSGAFSLPNFGSSPVVIGSFVGKVSEGGSCNVPVYNFTPHNLTHIETPNHIEDTGKDLSAFPPGFFCDIAQVVDLTDAAFEENYILPEHLPETLEANFVIFRTPLSDQPSTADYSGTDPISFHPSTMQEIVDRWPHVKVVLTDLPSVDKEDDGGKLLAHRNYFGLNADQKGALRAIVEFAHFPPLDSERYYIVMSPPHIQSDSFVTDILAYPLTQ